MKRSRFSRSDLPFWRFASVTAALALTTACASLRPASVDFAANSSPVAISGTSSATPFQPENNLPSIIPSSTPNLGTPSQTPKPLGIWVSPAVPDALRQFVLGPGYILVDDPGLAALHLDETQSPGSNSSVWIYALVAPFPTISDGVSLIDIKNAWNGTPSGSFVGRPLFLDGSTLAAFSTLWGPPAVGSVFVVSADQLVDSAWANRPSWALIPFESLDPRWKVLMVDGAIPSS